MERSVCSCLQIEIFKTLIFSFFWLDIDEFTNIGLINKNKNRPFRLGSVVLFNLIDSRFGLVLVGTGPYSGS